MIVPSTLTTEDRFLLLVSLLAGCVTTPALRLFVKYLHKKDVIASQFANWRGNPYNLFKCAEGTP